MKKIHMLDLSGQYEKIRQETEEAIRTVIRSSAFIQGPAVEQLATALGSYTGSRHVIPCGNGTDALQISLMASGLQAGDEVIIPAFTYMASAEAVSLLGMIPVFVDVDPYTFNISVSELQQAIGPKTKAIMPVHLFGQSADMEPILKIARENKLFVIEDAAQSIGGIYTFSDGSQKQCGTLGDTGCLSFFPSKNLGAFGDGGAILTQDPERAKQLKMIASHGQSVRYLHEMVGCNSRLDTLQAAILQVKLNYLDQYNAVRRQAALYYRENLKELNEYIRLPFEAPYATHVYNQFTIQVQNGQRDNLKAYLHEKDIPSTIYYPLPLPEQPVYNMQKAPSRTQGTCPTSHALAHSVLSLPMHTELEEEQLHYIVTQIKAFFE